MAVSRSKLVAEAIGQAVSTGSITADGAISGGGGGVTIHEYDSSGALLTQLDSSSLTDGSLHYLTKTYEMFLWDDSDGKFYDMGVADNYLGYVPPSPMSGATYGYASGGMRPAKQNVIQKWPFSSDGNSSDVGDLTLGRYQPAGQSSSESGYTSGGRADPGYVNTIDKFSFATDGNATDVGDFTGSTRASIAGVNSTENGYNAGGIPNTNIIDKFPFSTDANAADVGDLTLALRGPSGNASQTYGYVTGGTNPGGTSQNIIQKFIFSVDANATDVGDLAEPTNHAASMSSQTHGYSSGGVTIPWTDAEIIQKFPFAADGNAVDVANPISYRQRHGGNSSRTHGYTAGGFSSSGPGGYTNQISKFEFASDGNATDVGDLILTVAMVAGDQNY